MVDLPKNLKNVTGIELLDYSFPKDMCFINKKNNQFLIHLDGEEKLIELEDGNYSIEEIIEGLQSAFDDEKMGIHIDIDDDEHVVLINKKKDFILKNEFNSLGKVLGFTKNNYEGEQIYRSENKHTLVSKIYFYIDNISQDEPFGIIDLKNKHKPLIKKFNKPISEIKEMILKFKRRNTTEDDLIDFSEKPHRMTMKFESKNY
jgi:hypothetical protein